MTSSSFLSSGFLVSQRKVKREYVEKENSNSVNWSQNINRVPEISRAHIQKLTERVCDVNECNTHVQMKTPERRFCINGTRCFNVGFPETWSRFSDAIKSAFLGSLETKSRNTEGLAGNIVWGHRDVLGNSLCAISLRRANLPGRQQSQYLITAHAITTVTYLAREAWT